MTPSIPSLTAAELAYVPARELPPHALGSVAFGERVAGASYVPLRQLGAERLVETWCAPSRDVLFGSFSVEETKPLEELTREVYDRAIAHARSAGYPYFLRVWNYLGGINDPEAGLERYQRFCAGRHHAFAAAGYQLGADLPSASAVGMPGRGVVTCFLAAREPGVQLENPRQVSAYRYPARYGAKSPSFSRATVWRDTVFVSGTASVVGHESVHEGDVEAQLEETLRNLEAVLAQAGRSLASVVAAKTYIRRAEDYPRIAPRLEAIFPSNLFVEADICRRELLLEIEAVAR